MIFALPWALLGLAAIPALAAIYFLRSRSRPVPVSSHMLWMDLTRARQGGRVLKRMELPLLLVLETVALALLALAAAGPHLPTAAAARPLVIVLDDSFSMLAGDDVSPRNLAVCELDRVLRTEPNTSVSFILAGAEPQVLGDAVRAADVTPARLAPWRCQSQTATLDAAVALASTIAGSRARTLVLTDQAPPRDLSGGRILWRAFGEPRPNLAIVNAARQAHEGRERCLVEVANFSTEPRQAAVTLAAIEGGAAIAKRDVSLAPHEKAPLFFDLPAGTPAIVATLPPDGLALDNRVTLLPAAARPVRVTMMIGNPSLRKALSRAMEASGMARLVGEDADLVITDGGPLPSPERAAFVWSLQVTVDKEAEAFVGPFVMDRTHPLAAGLELGGEIWAAAKTQPLPGPVVIAAGNTPLLTDTEHRDGRHDLRLRLSPDLSTLPGSSNWPVLVWNILNYRAANLPGTRQPNVRLGVDVKITAPAEAKAALVRSPDGTTRDTPVHDGVILAKADQCGVFEVRTGADTYAFAANALAPGESDLAAATTGVWGEWLLPEDVQTDYRPIAWVAMALALACLVAHLALARQRQAGGEL
ncbi:MAG: BatA domain-containing protein [Planctomycetota bacterium]|nr:BatA domain-containing protein [Planctomycetota bacterium]